MHFGILDILKSLWFNNYILIIIYPSSINQVITSTASCTEFLLEQAKELGAESQVVECVPGKPIVLMKLVGEDPSLPSVLLNSHTDVVPVFPVSQEVF